MYHGTVLSYIGHAERVVSLLKDMREIKRQKEYGEVRVQTSKGHKVRLTVVARNGQSMMSRNVCFKCGHLGHWSRKSPEMEDYCRRVYELVSYIS